MNKISLLFSLFVTVSLFGDAVTSIELTDSEKLIFQNRKNITKINLKINNLKEEIDGIKSVLDSMGEKVSTPKKIDTSKLDHRISDLEEKVKKIDRENSVRFKKIEKSIQKILKILSSNKNNSFKEKKLSSKSSKESKKEFKKESKKIKILSVSEIYKNAKSFFKAKKYKEARDSFLDLVDKKYKLAESYYYIAETLFNQKRYKEAIHYYKKSVNEDDKSSFLAKLLLHTGVSFKNIGDKVGAKRFFNSLIGAYPNSPEAKSAKNYLKKL